MAVQQQLKRLPGPKEFPVIGNLRAFLGDGLRLRGDISRSFPNIGVIHLAYQTTVMISSAELIREVLTERTADFDKSHDLTAITHPILGLGLLTIPNQHHRKQRVLVQPAFNHRRVASYADTITQYAEDAVTSWRNEQTIDVTEEMMKLNLSIVLKTMFDADRGVAGDASKVGEHITSGLAYVSRYFLMPKFMLGWPLPANIRYQQDIKALNTIVDQIISERRTSGEDKGDFLSMLLSSRDEQGHGMSDEQVRWEAMNIFLAGHETTAVAMTWVFYLLAQHLGCYKLVQAEVDSVLQGRTPTYADLTQLPYCLQVIKEAMRLYPPVHFIARQAVRDTELAGYAIKKNALMFLDIWAMHRREEYFPRPRLFQPERFSIEQEKLIPQGAYLPFGVGPRVCIGNHFAIMQAHLLLATIVQRVRFERVSEKPVKIRPIITLRPDVGIKLVATKRVASR